MLGIALVTDMLAEGIVNTCNSVNYGYKRKKKKKRLVKITQLKLIKTTISDRPAEGLENRRERLLILQ